MILRRAIGAEFCVGIVLLFFAKYAILKAYRKKECPCTMKNKIFLRTRSLPSLLTVLILCASVLFYAPLSVFADGRAVVTTPPTGYTQGSDVVYVTFSKNGRTGVMNWGARGEDCGFLSPNAEAFYVGDYTYETLAVLEGGTQTSAPASALYAALRDMMVAEHSYIISYQNTRDLYAYTDCVSNDSTLLVSFYSGVLHKSTWDAGTTWNREHVWPNSKCIGDKAQDAADIMMLRPTLTEENGSRGNKAYGESSGYFDPGESVRGDCARILLYQYTRWGNTAKMWGTAGVMENVEILLRWMEEDPVDTWEMGRNDAVESITGTRNVFVDYPEYAWLLFEREVPTDLVTPSGLAASGEAMPEPPAVTESETEPETEPDFEMTQPEPPPATEPEFEMTQPEPPPATEPDFEMTQPEPPPVQSEEVTAEVESAPETALESVSETVSVTVSDTEAPSANASGGGCAGLVAGGTVISSLSLASLGILLTLPKRQRED